MNEKSFKILLVAGARPNFMKIAPLISAIKKFNRSISPQISSEALLQPPTICGPIRYVLVHTGQHYDVDMSDTFFRELEIPSPDINLEVGSASHAIQTANVMIRFEEVCLKEKPDWVVVVGDVNSTMACTLVASKIQYPITQLPNNRRPLIAHVEAGLRSFDRSMPEEINRVITDSLADLLFTPSEDADANLIKEGIAVEKIKRVGNIMIDTLVANLEKAKLRRTNELFGVKGKEYAFVTLHRPSNVDHEASLAGIMNCLAGLSKRIPVVFPVHPRTRKNLARFGLHPNGKDSGKLILCNPLGYHDTISLVDKARFVLTDSGGLQEETTFLEIPCLTLRSNTERPITIKEGTNKLTSLQEMQNDFQYLLDGGEPKGRIPELWDGHTAERIVKILLAEENV